MFLAAILDAFSRRVIGWAPDRNLDDELTLTALRIALDRRSPPPGFVHHSDRGSQYASGDYIALRRNIRVSMSRKGNPWDNAACESFMKTLNYWVMCHRPSSRQNCRHKARRPLRGNFLREFSEA